MVCGKTGWNGLCAVVLAAVFSLTLAGCGGGSSKTTEPMNPPMETTPLAAAKAAAMAAYEAAKKALDDVMANKDADTASYDAAAAQVAAAKSASDQAGAAETAEAAQLAQRLAERAKAEAERYAAMVTAAQAAAALQAVKDAAKAAYEAAKKALDDVMASKDADADSYAAAEEKVEAAKAANDEAQLAETLSIAQAAKDDAEKAKTETEKYTGMVKSASGAAAALQAAKDAAKAAYDAAKKALDDVMANKDADMDAYDTLEEKVEVARAANEKAQKAETLEEAQPVREIAETARDDAVKYARVVMKAHADKQLADVKAAAMAAYEAAKKTLDDVMDIKDTDKTSYDAAAAQVEAAEAANEEAQAAETLAEAQAAREKAEEARDEAVMHAGMVRDKQMAADEIERKAALTKSALTLEKAIEATKNQCCSGYGFQSSETGGGPSIDYHLGELIFTYSESQKMKKVELPDVLKNLGRGFEGQLHVRTEEQDNGKTIVRNKHYHFSNIQPDTQGSNGTTTPDQDWHNFGIWVKETEKDGVITYNNVQAGTSTPSDMIGKILVTNAVNTATGRSNPTLGPVEGSATYTGPAAGVYVHKAVKTDGTLDVATTGVFAADTNMTVNFGGADIPASKQFSISGAITNFRLSGGQANNWNLALEGADLKGGMTNTLGYVNGETDGGGSKMGKFSAVITYDSVSWAARSSNSKITPGFVNGRFTGFFVNGTVAGAYGVEKE